MELHGEKLLNAIRNCDPVEGLTHDFYRYPARFSPILARAVIEQFTKPGGTVLDPFVGGGTSLVEARALARNAIGVDINSLAVFISTVKTTPLRHDDLTALKVWAEVLREQLSLRAPAVPASRWRKLGYQRNINDRHTWPIRKIIELALHSARSLSKLRQHFARCVLLKTAQWALDCRRDIPTAPEFRGRLFENFAEMLRDASEFAQITKAAEQLYGLERKISSYCIHRSVVGLELEARMAQLPAPDLVLTSPPYPGVHVLYHRWQVRGRRESPAPYWIANSRDGHGCSHYTFGDRQRQNLTTYYAGMFQAFCSLAKIVKPRTTVVQILAFSDPTWQLPEYLRIMTDAGFEEIETELAGAADGRIWRTVPNRKWYASQRGRIHASREVVLFHRRQAI